MAESETRIVTAPANQIEGSMQPSSEILNTPIDLPGIEIVRTLHGSRLFGTATAESDVDIFGVFLPSGPDILMNRGPQSVRATVGNVDMNFLSLRRFMGLLVEGQTTAAETLFAPPIWNTHSALARSIWEDVLRHRRSFFSKKSGAFLGYCRAQAAKYGAKGDRLAACNMALAVMANGVSGCRLGDIEQELERLASASPHVSFNEREVSPGKVIRHLVVCDRMFPLTITAREAGGRLGALINEYGHRAISAQEAGGVDWKAIMHAVRVGLEAVELFGYGHLAFPLKAAPLLRKIRAGEYTLAELEVRIEEIMSTVESLAEASNLPDEPDAQRAERIVVRAYKRSVELIGSEKRQ